MYNGGTWYVFMFHSLPSHRSNERLYSLHENKFFIIFIFYFIYDCLPHKSFFPQVSFAFALPSPFYATKHTRVRTTLFCKITRAKLFILARNNTAKISTKEHFNFIIKRIKNAVKLITGEKSLWCRERERVHMGKFPKKFYSASPLCFRQYGACCFLHKVEP